MELLTKQVSPLLPPGGLGGGLTSALMPGAGRHVALSFCGARPAPTAPRRQLLVLQERRARPPPHAAALGPGARCLWEVF